MLCGVRPWAWLGSGSPGLLVGAQAADRAVPGTTAYAGIRGREATHSAEGALGSGRGTRTGRQVVGALRCAQVLQGHEGTGVSTEDPEEHGLMPLIWGTPAPNTHTNTPG